MTTPPPRHGAPTPHHRQYAELHSVEMFSGVTRRTLVSGAHVTLVEIRLASGAEVPEHTHPHEQAGYVSEGRVTLRFADGAERTLAVGSSYLIPGGEPHFVRALEPSTLIEVFSPVRDEFVDYVLQAEASLGDRLEHGPVPSEGGGLP
jgi:quercetin dioxygenase-like cupin family protein